jgi:hypothetical protein
MCDPVSLSIASTVIGAAGTAAGAMGQRSAAKRQAAEVHTWQEQQKKDRAAEQVRQEEFRQQAEKAQQQGLADVSGEAQTKRQGEEEARLAEYLQGRGDAATATDESGNAPQATADTAMFSGQQGGGEEFKTELAKKINEASTGAAQRMKALARVSSYGESFGGLGTENPLLQQKSGAGIDMANEFRRGSLGAFGVEKAVDPVQVTYTPSPMADIFSTALSLGAQGMGGQFGTPTFSSADTGASIYGNALFPKAPAAPKFFGPAVPVPSKYANTYNIF